MTNKKLKKPLRAHSLEQWTRILSLGKLFFHGRYWQKKRYEVIAKLEQLGPFQFFFTLSCADKRWDENFVALLQQKGLTINYRPCKVAKKKEGGRICAEEAGAQQ